MYAIFEDGPFQFKVKKGETLTIERRNDLEEGASLEFKAVLAVIGEDSSEFGTPFLPYTVQAEVVRHYRGEKLRIGKKKAKKRYERVIGHRQDYTEIRIVDIVSR